ncbi:uncharacterized protein LOC124623054 [Schistocerca americana]|uniref:uncharacterized protein LOC124623054 n=1 Tax=Schistocerca americana TaxID=7009 RepID=UPI001F4F362D|nr:uncharacterized protein LOC124623054 [Schistocerca americana]
MSEVLCEKKMSTGLKGKVNKSVIRPGMIYGAETWPVTGAQERKMEVAEMRMLRWMCGLTRKDRIRNEFVRGAVKVGPMGKKIQESRLRWYGYLQRKGLSSSMILLPSRGMGCCFHICEMTCNNEPRTQISL